MSAGEFSREALEARLGPDFARAEALGRSAPPPSAELVERVRRIFAAAAVRRERENQAAAQPSSRAA